MNPAIRTNTPSAHALTPYLVCDGADLALDFYKEAFGAVQLSRTANAQGRVLNAQLLFGDSLLMLMEEFIEFGVLGPKSLAGSPVTIHFRVKDVDEVVGQATRAGAAVKMAAKDEFWGDRVAVLEDPFGHLWSIACRTCDVSVDEVTAHAKSAMNVAGAASAAERI